MSRRIKKSYYSNLNEKNITDNKKFCKTITPFLSDKVLPTERITLIENDKIVNNDNETDNIMNTFFSNISNTVINLNVPEHHEYEGISRNISDPILKAITKYKNHPSIKAITRVSNLNDLCSFDNMDREKIVRKLVVWITQKHVKNQIYPQKLLKKMLIFFQKVFISRLMLQSMKEPLNQFSNWLIYPNF